MQNAGAESASAFRFRVPEPLDIVGIGVLLRLAEVLLELALELLGATLDVLAVVIGGIAQVAAKVALHFLRRALNLVFDAAFVEIFHRASIRENVIFRSLVY